MKASAICIDGMWRDVYKDPITDKSKGSKKGRLAVIEDFKTIRLEDLGQRENLLQPIFRNGLLLKEDTFEAIRQRSQR
jgi:nicotinamide phosphoribosyltransferase